MLRSREFQRDVADLFAARTHERAQAVNGTELVFEHVGHRRLDDPGIGAGQDGGDGDHGWVSVGKLADRESRVGQRAEHQQAETEHGRQNGAFDELLEQ